MPHALNLFVESAPGAVTGTLFAAITDFDCRRGQRVPVPPSTRGCRPLGWRLLVGSVQVSQPGGLRTARVQGTVEVNGVDEEYDAVPAGTAMVDVSWTGQGRVRSDRSIGHQPDGTYVFSTRWRSARPSGKVAGFDIAAAKRPAGVLGEMRVARR
jgi:hypothetical protein